MFYFEFVIFIYVTDVDSFILLLVVGLIAVNSTMLSTLL